MEKIVLYSNDSSLREELTKILPKKVKLTAESSAMHDACIFFDIDTMKAGLIREFSGNNLVIAVTRHKRTESVMEAVTLGAYEVIQRPLVTATLLQLLQEVRDLREEIKDSIALKNLPPTPTCAIVGRSPIMMDVCKKVARLSQVEVPVFITGETGTGKELIAESITQLSSRFGKPFVVVNCAAVPETLLESELFGFERGSFTSAVASKEGMLKVADEGCVFFDEVGELPLSLQGKLLRFLQTQTFYPIGSTKEVQVNVRIISATNRDVSAMIREGRFREDLYHRLRVAEIHIPSLRERKKDIPHLVDFFIGRYKHIAQKPIKGYTRAFLKKMIAYDWPGNIRELENNIRSAIALSKTDYLTTQELKELIEYELPHNVTAFSEALTSVLIPFIKEAIERKDKAIYERIRHEVDKPVFDYVLSYTKENQSEAARILGVNRLTLRRKLRY